MSTPKETNIRSSYIELNKYGLSGEYEKALKAANKSQYFVLLHILIYINCI